MRDRNAPLGEADVSELDWKKGGGLLPAIVQDADTLQVLMLGYMSAEALTRTLKEHRATFYSRSRQRLWTKGESSGHFLAIRTVHADCDADALLVLAEPHGPTCHLGTTGCFGAEGPRGVGRLGLLARTVHARSTADPATSYTAQLLEKGPQAIAQKIGEEGVELALAAAAEGTDACTHEAADLLYHLTVLMEARGFGWEEVARVLEQRETHARS